MQFLPVCYVVLVDLLFFFPGAQLIRQKRCSHDLPLPRPKVGQDGVIRASMARMQAYSSPHSGSGWVLSFCTGGFQNPLRPVYFRRASRHQQPVSLFSLKQAAQACAD